MLYDLVVLSFKLVPVFLFCDILGKINVGEIKNNEDINMYFITKFISLSNAYYYIRRNTVNTCSMLNDLFYYKTNEYESDNESNIELIRLYILKSNKIIQSLYTYSLEDYSYEESSDEEKEESVDEEKEESVDEETEESVDEETEESVDEETEESVDEEYETEYISENDILNARILFAGGNASDINDDDLILAYDSYTRSYQQISKNLIDLDNNEKSIVNIVKKMNSEMYDKSVFINVQLNLGDEVIDITKVSSGSYRTGNTIFGHNMLNYLTNFKYNIDENTEYNVMLMDSDVNMVNINEKQTLTLVNENDKIVYKINN